MFMFQFFDSKNRIKYT